jgi:hypothetical protein
MLYAYNTYKELNMSFADEIVKGTTLTQFPSPFSFETLINQIVFYAVALTILVACVCVCTLLIRKVIKTFKASKQP